jgi:hypothetical protein
VTPSVELGVGRPGRRLYGPSDVIKLAALGHFGRSGADVGHLGPRISGLALANDLGDFVLVDTGVEVLVVAASEIRAHLSKPGAYSMFDPGELRARMQDATQKTGPATARKSA